MKPTSRMYVRACYDALADAKIVLAQQEERLDALTKQVARTKNAIALGEAVSEIYQRVPLHIRISDTIYGVRGMGTMRGVADVDLRFADWYRNANHPNLWGLVIGDEQFNRKGERFIGANFKSEAEVMTLARNWVAFGEDPEKMAPK